MNYLTRIESRHKTAKLSKIEDDNKTKKIEQKIRKRNSEPEMKDLRREHWSRVEKEETSARKGKWDNVFSGEQLDNFRKETPVVFDLRSNSSQRAQSYSSTLTKKRRPILTEESHTDLAVQEE